jgi:hypothetical protein
MAQVTNAKFGCASLSIRNRTNPMSMQMIATTIEVGYLDGPGGTTGGVGRPVAGAHYFMDVETHYVGHDPYSGRSNFYIGVVNDGTFPPNTIARTNGEWRENCRGVIGTKVHVRGVPV